MATKPVECREERVGTASRPLISEWIEQIDGVPVQNALDMVALSPR